MAAGSPKQGQRARSRRLLYKSAGADPSGGATRHSQTSPSLPEAQTHWKAIPHCKRICFKHLVKYLSSTIIITLAKQQIVC